MVTSIDTKNATHTGLLFQLGGKRTSEHSDDELWVMAKEAAIKEMNFPYIMEMPCGYKQTFRYTGDVEHLPIEDVPCPCGNPNHWLIRFVDFRR